LKAFLRKKRPLEAFEANHENDDEDAALYEPVKGDLIVCCCLP